jgi:hypothetical protein
MQRDGVTIHGVLIVQRTELGWFVEIDHRPVFLEPPDLTEQTRMPRPGRRGPLTLTRSAAPQLGLARR